MKDYYLKKILFLPIYLLTTFNVHIQLFPKRNIEKDFEAIVKESPKPRD